MKKQYKNNPVINEAGEKSRASKNEKTNPKKGLTNLRTGPASDQGNSSTGKKDSTSFRSGASSSKRDATPYRSGPSSSKRESAGTRGNSVSKQREPVSYKTGDSDIKRKSSFKKEEGTNSFKSGYDNKSSIRGFDKYRPRVKRTSGNSRSGQLNSGPDDGSIRLNRYISIGGICSRRQADQYITEGLVSVNGTVVTELGIKVMPGDVVKFNGETIRAEKKVYVLLNKPKDYITTAKDNEGRKTVYDLIKGACKERVFPVGRLDRNSMGILLLTNDGELASRLSHPKFKKKKVYHVFLDKNLKLVDFEKIQTGIELQDGFIKSDDLSYVNPQKKSEVGIEIHSGKNRIVRRIFEHLGYNVIKLDRVLFAGLTKKNLQRGKWRFLTEKEINMLKMNAFE